MRKVIYGLIITLLIIAGGILLRHPIKAVIKEIMNQHILENPHIIAKSMEKYIKDMKLQEQQEIERKLVTHHNQIFNVTPLTPVIGNPSGNQAIVVFMEPFCPHCRNFEKTLDALVSKNKDLKIILRYVAIFGEKSELLIKLFLAASLQGQGVAARALIQTIDHKLSDAEMIMKFKDLSVDMVQLQKDLQSSPVIKAAEDNIKLMDLLNIQPVPTYIIKNKMVGGAHSLSDLTQELAEAYHK